MGHFVTYSCIFLHNNWVFSFLVQFTIQEQLLMLSLMNAYFKPPRKDPRDKEPGLTNMTGLIGLTASLSPIPINNGPPKLPPLPLSTEIPARAALADMRNGLICNYRR
jgi:hypothetical protein